MSARVDVLAVMQKHADARQSVHNSLGGRGRVADDLIEARAAVAELIKQHRALIEWAEAFIDDEYSGTSLLAEKLAELDPARSALARVGGAA